MGGHSSRSGKTFQLVRSVIIRAAKEKSRHLILRKRFNSAKTSIWMETIPKVLELCFPDLGAKPNKSDYYYYLPNGSTVWIAGLDDKERREKILGKEYSTLYFNECSQIEYSDTSLALTRLAEKNNLKKKAYYDENPPTKSHWSYWVFLKKLNPEDDCPIDTPEDYVSMLMNPVDNLENIDDNYLNLLKRLPENDKNRFLHGEFNDNNDGVAYYSFNRERHVKETSQVPGTIFNLLDFNVVPMTAVIAQVIDNRLVCHDEVFFDQPSDTYKMCDEIKKRNYIGEVIPDSTGRNRKTSGKSDFKILEDAGFKIMPTYNPLVRDRVLNVNRLFMSDQIIINPKCKKLINDLEKVSWKNDDLDEGPDKMLTHISDALGYGAWKLFPMSKPKLSTSY